MSYNYLHVIIYMWDSKRESNLKGKILPETQLSYWEVLIAFFAEGIVDGWSYRC